MTKSRSVYETLIFIPTDEYAPATVIYKQFDKWLTKVGGELICYQWFKSRAVVTLKREVVRS